MKAKRPNFFSLKRSQYFYKYWDLLGNNMIPNEKYNVPFPEKLDEKYFLVLTSYNQEIYAEVKLNKKGNPYWNSLKSNLPLQTSSIAGWKVITKEEIIKWRQGLHEEMSGL